MLSRLFLLVALGVPVALAAGICQTVFKDPNSEERPFFRVFEGQGVEIYYPKRNAQQEMFGIKIYKNQDLRKKDLHCDLCVNTTLVEDGCFKIKSTLLSVEIRDVLKYVTLSKFSGNPDVKVAASKKVEFNDYVIPSRCDCRSVPIGGCKKASQKITEYRPLFKFHESSGFAAYIPKASSTASLGLQGLKNSNFVRGGGQQKLDLNVDSLVERDGCFVYDSTTASSAGPKFALGDHLNFVVTGKKIGGEKIRTDPRKVFLTDYFIPSSCTCQPESSNVVKPQKVSRN
ncbi:uncharacterized protein LOC129747229 [Uranotaenia lowii]|uniref:uncharacterized protein LOC129747229 n=1 Tax=Uranotaenia lowii TaxID=190385 RepID=UPI00247A349D|nr:uncharacterized protein LOC129747229 [Uranotaenia lowii]